MVFLSAINASNATAHNLWLATESNSLYADWPLIASITQVGNNADEVVDFTLDGCTSMRLFAVGEGYLRGAGDYGTIENVDTGQEIWQMYYFETDTDGWSRNRRVDRPISLPAGHYHLRFRTNSTHSFDDWNDQPPDHRFWGIALYQDISADQSAPNCWDYADSPADLGWSTRALDNLAPKLEQANVAALMIVTDGQVVYEWGNTANNFMAHSMRKSLITKRSKLTSLRSWQRASALWIQGFILIRNSAGWG